VPTALLARVHQTASNLGCCPPPVARCVARFDRRASTASKAGGEERRRGGGTTARAEVRKARTVHFLTRSQASPTTFHALRARMPHRLAFADGRAQWPCLACLAATSHPLWRLPGTQAPKSRTRGAFRRVGRAVVMPSSALLRRSAGSTLRPTHETPLRALQLTVLLQGQAMLHGTAKLARHARRRVGTDPAPPDQDFRLTASRRGQRALSSSTRRRLLKRRRHNAGDSASPIEGSGLTGHESRVTETYRLITCTARQLVNRPRTNPPIYVRHENLIGVHRHEVLNPRVFV
jgi:hypothetical protein